MKQVQAVQVQVAKVRPSAAQEVIAREAIAMILIGVGSLIRLGFTRAEIVREVLAVSGQES